MDEIWQRVRRNILLSNTSLQDHSDDKTRECVGECLSQTYEEVIARCRASRKKKRDAEIPLDLSDENLSRMASLTDHLPLDDYDMLLHLVPRLVNVVTVRPLAVLPCVDVVVVDACACVCPLRSWLRPSPYPEAGSNCPSTCTTSPLIAPTPFTPLDDSLLFNWLLTVHDAASLSSVTFLATLNLSKNPHSSHTHHECHGCVCADTGRLVGTGA
tara:strand:- start:56 stop:697 length:642 start_codon:yes stop_codon:yes gene_type:complete